MSESTPAAKLGPVYLGSGITRGNGVALIIAGFLLGIVSPFINFAQPYILTEHLGIPANQQGSVSGDLAFWSEIVLISLAGLMGAWSDKSGRRVVFAFGFIMVAIAYVLYPIATDYSELLAYRLIFAVGMAAVGAMFVAVQAEYPADNSRGKLVGAMGVISILGVMFVVAALAPLPARFLDGGASAVEAGSYTYWTTAAISLLGVAVVWLGMAKRKPSASSHESIFARLRSGAAQARHNPRIALAYGAAFIGRTDLVIVVLFLPLWITQAGRDQGMSTEDALVQAGILFGVLQLAALGFAPIIGWIIDRITRVAAMGVATFIAMIGYTWIGLLDQPLGPQAYPAAVVLGMGQVSAIVAATALLGQESTAKNTGAVSGAFNVFGAIGILVSTKLGGWLFDAWMPGAPFLLTGVLNAIILVIVLAMIGAGLSRPAREPVGG